MSITKAKGTTAETAVVSYLNDNGILCVRNPPQGAKDKGDINLLSLPVVVEVKNHKRMELAEWADEAQAEKANADATIAIVAHKRARKGSPADWYWTLNGEDLVKLLKAASTTLNLTGAVK